MMQLRAICVFAASIFSCAQLPARAGEIHPAVRYECVLEPELIEVKFEYTETERALDIDLWNLLDTRDGYVTGERSAEGKCHFATDEYTVAVTPIPANKNLNGECGMHVFADVEILKGDERLVKITLGPTCPGVSEEYREKVILDVRSGKFEEFKRKATDAW